MKTIRLLEQSPQDVFRRVVKKPLILILVGTLEWHADHLPLGVDSLLGVAICEEISRRTGCIVAPLLSYGICRDLQPERGFLERWIQSVNKRYAAWLKTSCRVTQRWVSGERSYSAAILRWNTLQRSQKELPKPLPFRAYS